MIELGSAIDPGRKRISTENQDAIGIVQSDVLNRRPTLLIVADGMGGYYGGAIASRLVVQNVSEGYIQAFPNTSPLHAIEAGVNLSLHALRREAARNSTLAHMGSTVVAAAVKKEKIYLANVGDSRAYVINENEVRQISFDHSIVGEQLRKGLIGEAEVRTHPRRNVLNMVISAQRMTIDIFTGLFYWKPGDILVLCSDGLWGPVTEPQIQSVVLAFSPREAALKLIDLANTNQGPDNISVIVARYS